MRRERVVAFAIGVVAVVMAASAGCGVIAEDDAAAVGGVGIPASLVDSLVADAGFAQLRGLEPATTEGVLSGVAARQALDIALQTEALVQQVEAGGGTVPTDDTRLREEAQAAGFDPASLGPEASSLLARYVNASDLLAQAGPSDPPTDAELRAVYEAVGEEYWSGLVCATLVAAPPQGAEELEAAVEQIGDGDLADAVVEAPVSELVLDGECVRRAELEGFPPGLADDLLAAPAGERVGPTEYEVSDPAGGSQRFTVVYEVDEIVDVGFAEARAQLEGLLATPAARAAVTLASDSWVNPRYGAGVVVQIVPGPTEDVLVATVEPPQGATVDPFAA